MLSIILQFLGAILLSWNQITKSKEDLVYEGKSVIGTFGKLDRPKSIQILKNYFFNLLGFILIALGYLCQLFKLELPILRYLDICHIILIIIGATALIVILILLIARWRSASLIRYAQQKGPIEGEIGIGDGVSAQNNTNG